MGEIIFRLQFRLQTNMYDTSDNTGLMCSV